MKKEMKSVSSNPETQASAITFTEQDVQRLRDFGSFLLSNARFNLTIQEAVKLNGFVGFMNQLAMKMDSHILELKAIHTTKSEE
jgi:hypothetical protein